MQTCLYTVEVNKEKNCYTEERAYNVICQITVEANEFVTQVNIRNRKCTYLIP